MRHDENASTLRNRPSTSFGGLASCPVPVSSALYRGSAGILPLQFERCYSRRVSRVLLVLPPGTLAGDRFKVTHQPIVAAYLAAAAGRAGAEVTVVDALLDGFTPSQVAHKARDVRADVVAVVPYEYRRELTLETSLAVASELKSVWPHAMTGFLNGVESSSVAALKTAVGRGQVDFVTLGDSEEAFEAVLRSGIQGDPPAGVIFGDGAGGLREGRHREATDLNTLAFPEWSLFRWRDYEISSHRYRTLPLLPVLGSRACPYKCDFCPQALFNTRQKHRVRDPRNITEEVLQLVPKYGIREVEFYDATFGTRPQDARELCALLEAAGRPVAWACNSRCDLLDEKLLRAMKRAGCYRLLFGVESGDQAVLDATGKNQDLAQVRETFAICRRLGIETIASFIIGLPGETPASVERSMNLAIDLEPTYAQFHLARAIIDKQRWRDGGTVIGDWEIGEEGFNGQTYLPKGFGSYADLQALHRRAYLRFYGRPRYVVRRLRDLASWRDARRLASGGLLLLRQLTSATKSLAVRH